MLARELGSYLPETGRVLTHPRPGWLTVAVAAELVSMAAFSELQRTVLRAGGPHASARGMLGLTFEANAVSGSLPAGSALAAGYTFRRFRTWGSSAPAAGFTLVVSGLVSSLAFGVLAVVVAPWAGGVSAGSIPAAVLGGASLVAVLLGVRQLRRHPATVDRLIERSSAIVDRLRLRRRSATTARSRVAGLISSSLAIRATPRMWSGALLFAAINWAADLACLLADTRVTGTDGVTLGLALLAYVAGISVSSVSLVPGGLGIVEAAMILALVQAGTPHAAAIASVLVYRLVSYLLMVVIGWSLWLVRSVRGTLRTSMSNSTNSASKVVRSRHEGILHSVQ